MLLPEDVRFTWKYMWKKLRVQVRVVHAFPMAGSTCLLDGTNETHYHRVKGCVPVMCVARMVRCAFGLAVVDGVQYELSRLSSD